jgi:uncharacterized iron-regulated protein
MSIIMSLLRILCLVLIIPAIAVAQRPLEDYYRIYDTRQEREVPLDSIVHALSNADVLFFGEDHGDSIGHVLELRLLEACHQAYGDAVVLSLEMFEKDVQLILDEYLRGAIREKNLLKDARVWKNYQDYRPLVEYAKTNKIPVVAANAPSRYTNMVTMGGLQSLQQLDKRAKAFLPPLPIDTAVGRYYERFNEVMGGHGAMSSMHIYQSQNLWDAAMAWSVYQAWRGKRGTKVLHLNGRFHTDEKLGIPAQLQRYAEKDRKKMRVLNISSFPDTSYHTPGWEKYRHLGDFIILTDPLKPAEG